MCGGGRAHGRRRVSLNTIVPCAWHKSQPVETYKTQPGSSSFWDTKGHKVKVMTAVTFYISTTKQNVAQDVRTRVADTSQTSLGYLLYAEKAFCIASLLSFQPPRHSRKWCLFIYQMRLQNVTSIFLIKPSKNLGVADRQFRSGKLTQISKYNLHVQLQLAI